VLNAQLISLSACLADEIMGSTGIKQNDSRVSIQKKCTHEDLLALGNVLHGSVVDTTGLCNGHLLQTIWQMGDVVLSGILLRRRALSSEVARATTGEAGVARGGSHGRWRRQAQHRWRWR
jgi:hypothetical protein